MELVAAPMAQLAVPLQLSGAGKQALAFGTFCFCPVKVVHVRHTAEMSGRKRDAGRMCKSGSEKRSDQRERKIREANLISKVPKIDTLFASLPASLQEAGCSSAPAPGMYYFELAKR